MVMPARPRTETAFWDFIENSLHFHFMSQNIIFAFCSFTFFLLALVDFFQSHFKVGLPFLKAWGQRQIQIFMTGCFCILSRCRSTHLHTKIGVCFGFLKVKNLYVIEILFAVLSLRGNYYLKVYADPSFESLNVSPGCACLHQQWVSGVWFLKFT